jgi:hypothetical protein
MDSDGKRERWRVGEEDMWDAAPSLYRERRIGVYAFNPAGRREIVLWLGLHDVRFADVPKMRAVKLKRLNSLNLIIGVLGPFCELTKVLRTFDWSR